jgi:hypothetical protein
MHDALVVLRFWCSVGLHVSISAKDCQRLCTNFRACCSANKKLWNRLNISFRKVELGDKALLDIIDGPGPDDQEIMEEATLESFLESGSFTQECECVELTSNDLTLFFGEDDQPEDLSLRALCQRATLALCRPRLVNIYSQKSCGLVYIILKIPLYSDFIL